MSNLISKEEMVDLTGAVQGAKQCEVLRENGLRFTRRADGSPSLSWEAYNRQIASAEPQRNHFSEPNLKAV